MKHILLKNAFLLLLGLSAAFPAFTQSKVEQAVQLITSESIAEATLDVEAFGAWAKPVLTSLKEIAGREKGGKEIIVVLTFHHDRDPDIQVAARPQALKSKVRDEILQAVRQGKPFHTRTAPYTMAIRNQVNGGPSNEDAPFQPALIDPPTQRLEAYKALDTQAKREALIKWADEVMVPLLAYFAMGAEPEFEGVRAMGKILDERRYRTATVEELTVHNPDYWRAFMEMEIGNQLITYARIAMHLAKGEFDKASRLMFVANFFSDEKTVPGALHPEIEAMLEALLAERNQAIAKGIALHDKGKYDEAIRLYRELEKTFPRSAYLQYEIYYSTAAKLPVEQEGEEAWKAAKPLIYGCDPLYPMDVRASNGEEGYRLFRRQEIGSLFKSRADLKKDLLNYADIALDLGVYDFAAQLYWWFSFAFEKEDYGDRDLAVHYFYCLDKLGNTVAVTYMQDPDTIRAQFPGIEAERRRIMEADPMYKAFKK